MTDKTIYGTGDYTYTIEETRYGLFTSILADGTKCVTGPTLEATQRCTDDIHIPVLKGTFDGWTSTPRASVVEGKL